MGHESGAEGHESGAEGHESGAEGHESGAEGHESGAEWGMRPRSFGCMVLLLTASACGDLAHQSVGGGSSGESASSGAGGSGYGLGDASGPIGQPDAAQIQVSTIPPVSPGAVVSQTVTRLTAVEYANTVNDLLGVPPSAQSVPLGADSNAGGFNVGGASTDDTAQAYHDSAVALATLVTSAASLPTLLLGANCTAPAADTTGVGAACATAFIGQFAPLAFRHGPVDAATVAGLNGVYAAVAMTQGAGFSGGMAAVLEEMLQSPYFLYHLETEQQALGMYGTPIAVTGYSMANRLSYLLWSSMPDAALFAAAANNQLSTAAQVAEQAERMLQDPKAHVGLRNFYQQWLTALSLPSGKVGNSTQLLPNGTLSATSLFGTTNGLSLMAEFSPALQQAIVESFDMQAEAALWAPTNAMKALLTSTTMYANSLLAPVLGVTVPAGTAALAPVLVDGTKRAGILSHPLLMATYATTSTSHPIHRGVFVWDQIVCQPLPYPPAGEPAFTPPPPGMGLRQDYELMTLTGRYLGQVPPATAGGGPGAGGIPCPSCHTRLDPVGFLFEPFDTVGQYRTIDDYGVPVDLTNITVNGFTGSDAYLNVTMSSSVQLATALANSDLPDACLTENLYRYMARRADSAADFPVEAWLDETFVAAGENLTPALVGLTRTDVFLERVNAQ